MQTATAPAAPSTCRCGDALSDHIGGKPCVFGTPRGEVRIHDLPIFGRFWAEDARDRRA